MSARVKWIDEYTLLCEQCGYVLEGLPREGKCPECGKPILESVPEARMGSAWQKEPGWASWTQTAWAVLIRPKREFAAVRIESLGSLCLRDRTLFVASLFPAAPMLIGAVFMVLLKGIARFNIGDVLLFLGVVSAVGIFEYLLLCLLTGIESWGIRFFGRRRGWRVTKTVAETVCAHASVGWLVCAITVSGVYAGLTLAEWFGDGWHAGLSDVIDRYIGPTVAATFILGMLVFETRVYIGLRRCKFANRAKPPSPTDSAPA